MLIRALGRSAISQGGGVRLAKRTTLKAFVGSMQDLGDKECDFNEYRML